jgi:hypothetical protein
MTSDSRSGSSDHVSGLSLRARALRDGAGKGVDGADAVTSVVANSAKGCRTIAARAARGSRWRARSIITRLSRPRWPTTRKLNTPGL